ncbi:hypothetical protein EUX98_g615 [Antrodiella citrinella]|uniref:chitin deacetylase n=1 Tax=Antrodiella citrinella TaxID=2447956 RepID=A0A4S4N6W2_9APHY|nr:hypothetical protein EUX98_g615 [Antrodiella citrinella]
MFSSSASLVCLFSVVYGLAVVHAAVVHAHDHLPTRSRLPTNWYHDDDHAAHILFKRGPTTDGVNYATVGSPAWSANFPQGTPDSTKNPQPWTDALNAAVTAGKIPDIPPSKATGGNPVYPNGLDPNSAQVCSSTYKCNTNPDVIWNAPDGVVGLAFDDGPQPASDQLYAFLQQNNEHATHFFIGINILNNANEFITAFETLEDDIAVHTWTHPYMTTLSNDDVVAQLGYTMELIHNSTGGRLPRYWRPPYGDSDNRVAAIAKEIFGLTTVVWNQDTEDWSIPSGGTTNAIVQASMTKWLTGPKSPGLIILEHELYPQTVQAFMSAYPLMKQNGWKTMSVAQIQNASYQNSANDSDVVIPQTGILLDEQTTAASSTSSSASSNTASNPTTTNSPASTSGTNLGAASPSGAGTALQKNVASHMFSVPIGIFAASFVVILSALAIC